LLNVGPQQQQCQFAIPGWPR